MQVLGFGGSMLGFAGSMLGFAGSMLVHVVTNGGLMVIYYAACSKVKQKISLNKSKGE